MNKISLLLILVLISIISSCRKDNTEISKLSSGTYYGEKTIYYSDTHYESVDTITIRFDSTTYTYSSSESLDFGKGNYLIKNNSIEFKDEVARIALYTWDWILGGTYKLQMTDDSIMLNQNNSYIQISCRLKRMTK